MKPEPRLVAVGGVGVLVGIGLTAAASYLALLREQWVEKARVEHVRAEDEIGLAKGRETNGAVRDAENHIRALLRAPRVSDRDRETDAKAAQKWLAKYGRHA